MDPGALGAAGAWAMGAAGAGGRLAARSVHPARRRRPLRGGAPAADPGGLDRENLRPAPAPAPAAHAGVDGADSNPAGPGGGGRASGLPHRDKGGRRRAESLVEKKAGAGKILTRLAKAYPDARTALDFTTPLELLVATILSAQCTDERVNAVTAGLFPRYRQAADWAGVPLPVLEREIHSTGFFRAKARSLNGMARALVERHGGEVPRTLEELVELPGVGRKTANVVLGNAFGIPALAVDTHVFRVSQRLGLARGDDPEKIHDQLCLVLPQPGWTQASHLLILHGRRVCFARKPACPPCPVEALCPFPGKTKTAKPVKAAARPRPRRSRS